MRSFDDEPRAGERGRQQSPRKKWAVCLCVVGLVATVTSMALADDVSRLASRWTVEEARAATARGENDVEGVLSLSDVGGSPVVVIAGASMMLALVSHVAAIVLAALALRATSSPSRGSTAILWVVIAASGVALVGVPVLRRFLG